MDTQEFLDVLNIWTESYRGSRDPEKDYPPGETPDEIQWENGMLKVATVITAAESLEGTPAIDKLMKAKGLARLKDRSKLKDIYNLLHDVEEYLKSTLE